MPISATGNTEALPPVKNDSGNNGPTNNPIINTEVSNVYQFLKAQYFQTLDQCRSLPQLWIKA